MKLQLRRRRAALAHAHAQAQPPGQAAKGGSGGAASGGAHGAAGAGAGTGGRRRGSTASSDGGSSDSDQDDDNAVNKPLGAEEKLRLTMLMQEENHYGVLGLEHLGVNASDEQIRTAYRRLILRYHPDKKTGESGAIDTSATDPLFLAIQKAYDVLSNEEKRRAYDSQFEFDDSIPSATDTGEFFAAFGPVFERNARFSVQRPVPRLGGPDDSEASVRAFYDFWFHFESWRDFSAAAEHNTEDADGRYEKRWMEQQNKAAIAKKKKAEIARIVELTTRAYARDPRIAAFKRAEEDAKRAVREAKAAAARAAEEAARRLEADRAAMARAEEDSRKAEAAARRAQREREKKAVKRARTELRKLADAAVAAVATAPPPGGGEGATAISDEDLDFIAGKLELKALQELLASAEAEVASGGDVTTLRRAIATAREADAAAELAKKAAAAAAAASAAGSAMGAAGGGAAASTGAKAEREWGVQELSMLAKGIARYPGGTRNRWACIAAYVNGLGQEHPRTPEECIAKAQRLERDAAEEKARLARQAFAVSQASRGRNTEVQDKDAVVRTVQTVVEGKVVVKPVLVSASGLITPSIDERLGGDRSDGVAPSAAAAAPASASPVAVAAAVAAAATSSSSGPSTGGAAAAAAKPAKKAKAAAAAAEASGSEASAALGGDAAAVALANNIVAGTTAESEAGVWTLEQQSALEAALKRFPATMEKNERWRSIAEAVPGKTKKQCVARFKDIREQVLASQCKG